MERTMATSDVIDEAGTPRQDHVFAAFKDVDSAQAAAAKLDSSFGEPTFLTGDDDARSLHAKDAAGGVLDQVKRILKTFGGEENMAVRYAERLDAGCVVIAVPVENREAARLVADQLSTQGAFDIAYFGRWTTEFFHSAVIGSRRPETTPGSQGDTTM
jgi:hypothetical protein